MKNRIIGNLIVISLLVLLTTLAEASQITDWDTIDGPRSLLGDDWLYYTHDIVDDGYDPGNSVLLDATLSINIIDPLFSAVATVMFDYEGSNPEELAVEEGSQIVVLQASGNMFYARREDGKEGYLPKTYVVIRNPEYSEFQLSFDRVDQDTHKITSDQLYQFTIPLSYLLDGRLDLDIHSIEGGITFDYAHLDVLVAESAPVPVPATVLLLGIGLIGLAGAHRKMS